MQRISINLRLCLDRIMCNNFTYLRQKKTFANNVPLETLKKLPYSYEHQIIYFSMQHPHIQLYMFMVQQLHKIQQFRFSALYKFNGEFSLPAFVVLTLNNPPTKTFEFQLSLVAKT